MLIAIAKSVERTNVWSIQSIQLTASVQFVGTLPKHLKYREFMKTNKNHSNHGKYTEQSLFSVSKRLINIQNSNERLRTRYEIFYWNSLTTQLNNDSINNYFEFRLFVNWSDKKREGEKKRSTKWKYKKNDRWNDFSTRKVSCSIWF